MRDPLAVLYEDPHCLAVAKPAGVLTQGRPAGESTLEAAVRRYLKPGAPDSVYLGTVHRLDRPVSGVVVWAKTPKAARRLAAQFAARTAGKHYWAVAEAAPGTVQAEGAWDDWVADPGGAGRAQPVAPETPGARHTATRFRVGRGATLPNGTLWLRLWPETGRTHQLRAQAAARGLPIVGDTDYGSARPFPRGIALHARALRVAHPVLRTTLTWVAPVPEAWAEAGIVLPDAPAFE
jgi:23S rRNA pseudouridine1911/1915/1917 synthase